MSVITPPMSVLIVDDEELSRGRVRQLLAREPDVVLVDECCDGLEALNAIRVHAPELVFLDVQMPELDGFGVLDALGRADGVQWPEVIFTTAYNAYLERAFEVHAVDFLRKPFTDDRFAAALAAGRRRVLARRRELADFAAVPRDAGSYAGHVASADPTEDAHNPLTPMLEEVRRQQDRRRDPRLAIQDRRRGTWNMLPKASIDRISVERDGQVHIHAGGKEYAWRKPLGEVEELLDPAKFLRVHRSHLINADRITQVKSLTKGEYLLTLADGTALDTGRSYRKVVEDFLRGR